MGMLSNKDYPRKLWKNNTLYMPDCLVSSYDVLLDEYGIKNMALELHDPGRVIGGPTLQATLEYFARRYGVSACRIESLILDPDGAFLSISDDLTKIFSEGNIALLDVACGSGSVGASLLSTFLILRKEQVLPMMPTSINIVGGDCSPYALEIYTKMMTRLLHDLEGAGIQSHLHTINWLAEESYTTSELFDLFFSQNPEADEYVVFIANFSGAMDSHSDEYKSSIQHMFDRTHNKRCVIVWVEPGNYHSALHFFENLRRIIDLTGWRRSTQIGPIEHDYKWFHPLQNRVLPCRVLIKAYDNNGR